MEKLFDIFIRIPVLAHSIDDLETLVNETITTGLTHIQDNPLLKASDDITIVQIIDREEEENNKDEAPTPPPATPRLH